MCGSGGSGSRNCWRSTSPWSENAARWHGTVETGVDLVEAEEAALVCAYSGDRRELAVVVHDEPDVRRGGEPRDLPFTEIRRVEHRLPGAFVGNQFLCCRDRRRGLRS